MNTKNKMLNILSAIDETDKNQIIQELSDPMYEIGFKPTVLKLINQMLDQGLIEESSTNFIITAKGKSFYEETLD